MFRRNKKIKAEIKVNFIPEDSQVRIFVDSNGVFPQQVADSMYDMVISDISGESNLLDLLLAKKLDLSKLEIILREK